jgi:TPR repeat protein
VLFSQAEDLLLGRTGPRDVARAVALYRQAAAAGSSSAMNTLGRLYETGEGVTRNEATALQWYQRAAGAGHPDAIASVTRLQRRGTPSRKPDAKP